MLKFTRTVMSATNCTVIGETFHSESQMPTWHQIHFGHHEAWMSEPKLIAISLIIIKEELKWLVLLECNCMWGEKSCIRARWHVRECRRMTVGSRGEIRIKFHQSRRCEFASPSDASSCMCDLTQKLTVAAEGAAWNVINCHKTLRLSNRPFSSYSRKSTSVNNRINDGWILHAGSVPCLG